MSERFLYEQLNGARDMGMELPEVGSFISSNLNPDFGLREYQKEALSRFFHCWNKPFEGKELPLHILFNMATGSGKTLIMAGLILYLYEQGHRNFLFFVNSTNIIEKTKDNFLNNLSSKYLFSEKIFFGNKEVQVKEVTNFDGVSDQDINICFTTIQKLHSDLINEKENSLTFEDFKDKEIILIADEAHHGQVQTRQQALSKDLQKPNWENTVESIFQQNSKNLLLEFTATMDWMNRDIVEKYKNKVIYRYDLKEFRNDFFSKDVNLLHTQTDRKDRILQAIILSQYRQEVAGKNKIDLKPVILFKAQKTIAQSEENKVLLHKTIDELSGNDIERIRKNTNIEVLQKAFKFFEDNKITDTILVNKLKNEFSEEKTLSANEEGELRDKQLLLNSLEDKNNKIRAIFAVQKLNEGWDVLNLFDIVRLYETRDGRAGKPGKTTISEAQLIGRGARYFPFKINLTDDKYKRKYDNELDNELRVLEELYYHSHNESRYISEIKSALIQEGMLDETGAEIEWQLKMDFKKKDFYKKGVIYANKKIKRTFDEVKSIKDLGVSLRNIPFRVISGTGADTIVFEEEQQIINSEAEKDIKIKEIEPHIVRSAINKIEFFNFDNLKEIMPELSSISEFISNNKYLADLGITLKGNKETLQNLDSKNKLEAVLKLLNTLEKEIKGSLTEYTGTTEFHPSSIREIFKDTKIKVKQGLESANKYKDSLLEEDWYVYNTGYGTSEEKSFVELIDRCIPDIKKKFKEVYLFRNEKILKIYNFKDGKGFEPDFVLFLINKNGKMVAHQLFMEPKGEHLIEHDKWKDDFLARIQEKFKDKKLQFSKTDEYKITGLPFYNTENENDFKEKLLEVINN